MGEYVMTTVTIGGPLKDRQAVAGLIAATGRTMPRPSAWCARALAEGASVTFEDLQDFGLTPALDAFCQEHGLSYLRAWCARSGVFDAGVRHWRPGLASRPPSWPTMAASR